MAGLLRKAAADFWLNLLFWQARRNPPVARACKPLILWGAWKFAVVMRDNTLCNARRLLGDSSSVDQREQLAKAVIGNFYDFVCEVGHSVGMSRDRLLERVAGIEGHDRYQAVRGQRKGAIILTAHMGSFEVGMAALLEYEKRIYVLFRRDELGLFEQTRSTLRKRLGVVETPVDEGLAAWMRLRDALTADEVVLIQGDRVMPGQKGRRMPFLGGHMLIPSGPVKLALATGAPIVPIFSVRQPDGRIRLFVEEPIRVSEAADVEPALLQMARVIEDYVRRYPQQWLMLHRAWCEDVE